MKKNYWAALLFIVFLLIYSIGSFSKIPFADCIGFVLSAEEGIWEKTCTPTSHFLYINTVIILKKIFYLDGLTASRWCVVLCGAGTVAMIFKTALLVSKKNWLALMVAFIFGFSFSYWRNAEIVEVYTFSCFCVSLFYYYFIKCFLEKSNNASQNLLLCTLFIFLSILIHIQNIFLIPSFLILIYQSSTRWIYKPIAFLMLASVFGLMIFLNFTQGLPLKSFYSSSEGHSWIQDSFKKNAYQYAMDLAKSILYLVYNFNLFVLFGIKGCIALYKKQPSLFFAILPAAVLNYGFATFYAVSDNYVFFFPFYLLFAAAIAYGISCYSNIQQIERLSPLVLLTPFFILFHIISSFRYLRARTLTS